MAKGRSKKTKKKRTLSPEHLQKLQEGRKNAQIQKKREKELKEKFEGVSEHKSKYSGILDKFRR